MRGMHPITGRTLSGLAHVHYSIAKILTTPLGSRVMRRGFGSNLCNLVDAPNNTSVQVQLYAAVAGALTRFEPRLTLSQVQLIASSGTAILEITGTVLSTGEAVHAQIPFTEGG